MTFVIRLASSAGRSPLASPIAAALAIALLASCAASTSQPAPAAAASAPPPAELSTIVMPVRASIAPLIPLVEAQVPKDFTKLDAYEIDPQGRFGLKYKMTREPVSLFMQGSGLHADLTVHYGLEGCLRSRNPVNGAITMWPCLSCGLKEPMRRAVIRLQTRLDWNDNWTMRSKTTALPVEFPSRCRVTFANIDLTDWKLAPIVNEQLRAAAATIDHNTPAVTSIRKEAQQIWSSLQAPYEIAPRTWLVFEPVDVAVAPISGTGLTATSAFALHARTRVVVGERPVTTRRELPPLRPLTNATGGIRVPLDFEVSYEDASRLMTEQFGNKVYDVGGAKLGVESISLAQGKGGKVGVTAAIDYRGGALTRYRGLVYLEGTPAWDAASNSVSIADLDYALDPKRRNPFTRTADRIAHDAVRARLRQSARWPLTAEIATIRSEIERGLSRPMAFNVAIRGRVDAVQPLSLTPLEQAISIRVVVTGVAEVEVR